MAGHAIQFSQHSSGFADKEGVAEISALMDEFEEVEADQGLDWNEGVGDLLDDFVLSATQYDSNAGGCGAQVRICTC